MAPECQKLNKRVAELIAIKRKENYSSVMMHVRTRLRFALLKSTLVALRGFRGQKRNGGDEGEIGDIAYNLIPEGQCYETI